MYFYVDISSIRWENVLKVEFLSYLSVPGAFEMFKENKSIERIHSSTYKSLESIHHGLKLVFLNLCLIKQELGTKENCVMFMNHPQWAGQWQGIRTIDF